MQLTVKDVYDIEYVNLATRKSSDYSDLNYTQIEGIKNDLTLSQLKKDLVESKYYTAKFLNDDIGNNSPEGNEYYDEETDTVVEYIALDRLRFKIEELGKRETGNDDFTLGKKVWEVVIEKIEIGEKVDNSFVAFDDIDDCYKARHPRSRQQGFNIKCINKFYRENIEKILVIKEIVDKRIKKQAERKAKERQAEAKERRAEAKALANIGGLI